MPDDTNLSADEYLTLDGASEARSEFFDGTVTALGAARAPHDTLVSNLVQQLSIQLMSRPGTVFGSNQRLAITTLGKYTYADVSVARGEGRFEGSERETLLDPTVVFEVLSEASEAYDRGRKFEHYQRLDSLREYLLVSPHSRRIEHFIRQESNLWTYGDHTQSASSTDLVTESLILLPSIECTLHLDEVYAKTGL